jgi:pyruvate dehydrogenase E1 component alpha subunit
MLERIYRKAALSRAFELACEERIRSKVIRCPVYLATGQEYPSATLAVWCEDHGIRPHMFVQHRAHAQYLAFGGDIDDLIHQILYGMEGSNCIQSKAINLYGHDSLLATQVPIATGFAYARREPVICFMGDAACEEDYVLASLGWAETHSLPILYVVEDNNLSILTEKSVRRSWTIHEVARGFGMLSGETSDDPHLMYSCIPPVRQWPALMNVCTTRLRWHAGAGCDGPAFDRHEDARYLYMNNATDLDDLAVAQVEATWQRCVK